MTMGLVGRKCGMTRVFTEDGISIPVTVIEAQPNQITQVKTVENDGYRALQVSAGQRKASRVSKPQAGHFAQAKVEAGDLIAEFRLADTDEGHVDGRLGDQLPHSSALGLRVRHTELGKDGELAAGLDTQVGERGSSLSVGERQLVTLVRAAIADPELLVLDEATSYIDSHTEAAIHEALHNLTAGRTCVLIDDMIETEDALSWALQTARSLERETSP